MDCAEGRVEPEEKHSVGGGLVVKRITAPKESPFHGRRKVRDGEGFKTGKKRDSALM